MLDFFNNKKISSVLSSAIFLCSLTAYAVPVGLQNMAYTLHKKYSIPVKYTINTLSAAHFQESVIDSIKSPKEKVDWYVYKKFFVNKNRIKEGKLFLGKYKKCLQLSYKRYGVNPKLIAAILGIESNYGHYKNKYKALNALYTLAFYYPQRSTFFRSELENFIVYTYDYKLNPFKITSSYAGAIGIPQFMPSNILKYAVDFDNDNKINLDESVSDAVGSAANFLKSHGWDSRLFTAIKVHIPEKLTHHIDNNFHTIAYFKKLGVIFTEKCGSSSKAKIIALQGRYKREYWAVSKNFYVIKTYNSSDKYVLSAAILSSVL